MSDTTLIRAAKAVAFSARSTQRARQQYWATVADETAPAWLLVARRQGLRIAEEGLLRACGGSKAKARAAEVAYIESVNPR